LRRLSTLALLAILTAAPVGAAHAAQTPTPAPAAGIAIGLVDVPAAAQNDPRARSYIVDHMNPGASIERRIRVQNNTAQKQSVHLYSGAAHLADNAFTAEDQGASNALTSWTSVATPDLDMAPGEEKSVPVKIAVPGDAPEGEQYAVVWAQVQSPKTAGSAAIQVSRVGIREYIAVGPGNGQASDFKVESLTTGRSTDGKPQVTAKVTNTGGRAIDLNGTLSLSHGPAGMSAGPFPIVQGTTLAAGASADVAVVLDGKLPSGAWDAVMTVKSGSLSHEASASITIPEAAGVTTTTAAQDNGPQMLLIAAGAVLILITGVCVFIALKLRARKKSGRRSL
jgi:hypothetical protein